jgi:hypothetical protein
VNTTTIKINGLDVEFSEKAPNRIGPYWWCYRIGSVLRLREVFNPCGDVLIDRESDWQPEDAGGLWSTSPLVPAVEVSKAHAEGCSDGGKTCDKGRSDWNTSRAKRVTEGGE